MSKKNKKPEMKWCDRIDPWIKSKMSTISKWVSSKAPNWDPIGKWLGTMKKKAMSIVSCPDCRAAGVMILFGASVWMKCIDPWTSVAMLAWLKAASLILKHGKN